MWHVGVDENGLGPRLGPLVATAAAFAWPEGKDTGHWLEMGKRLGVDDSKATAAFGKVALAESLALAAHLRLRGAPARDFDALLEGLGLDAPSRLRARCPASSEAQCWSRPLPLPCFGGDVDRGEEILERLAKQGVHLRWVRSAQACTGALNDALQEGRNRLQMDLELFERLVIEARSSAGEDLEAICGMVGGLRRYLPRLRHIDAARASITREQGGVCAYRVEGVGSLSFEVDADAGHLPVAFASMIGKYVRELWMERQNRYYRDQEPTLQRVSGYHDPVTARFVRESEGLRARLQISDDCFERRKAGPRSGGRGRRSSGDTSLEGG